MALECSSAKLEKIEDVRVQELYQTEIHPLQMTTNVRLDHFVETYTAALASVGPASAHTHTHMLD